MMSFRGFLLAGLAFCGAVPALAEGAATDSSEGAQGTIVVTGERTAYGVRATSTATKTNTDIRNIPQALSVISEAQIEDQQLRSVADLLNFVPGASYGSGEGNRDQIVLRGNSSTADFFVDGVRDDTQYFRDFYNIGRVEVLKGPNAMIFGRGGGGGIVNRVLKRPTLNPAREVSGSGDGFGRVRTTLDLDQPLSSAVGVRLNAMYEDGDSFRRHVDLKRYGINPTAAVLVGPDTRVDLSYEYFHDRRTADRGVPAFGSGTVNDPTEPLTGFRRTFFGDPDKSFAKADVNLATLAVEHKLGEGLTVRNRTMFGDYDKFYQNIYPSGYNPDTDIVTLGAYNNATKRQNLFSQTDLIWENRLGGVDQTLLFGFEAGRQKSRNLRQSGTFARDENDELLNWVPLSDPTTDAEVTFAPAGNDANSRTRATVAAIYVQDQIRPTDWLEIVAGLRFDRFKLAVNDLRVANEDFIRTDNLWSPRLGLILKPSDNLSIYSSFSRSYLPQSGDQFSGLTSTTAELKPERFDNYELGAKWEPIDGLLATAAIYRLDRTNTRATDPLTNQTVLTGAQRTRGIELGLERSITSRWLISGGYSWQKAEITKKTTAAPAGRDVPLVPRHSFSLWNRYELTRDIGVGFGVIARSKSYASISNKVKLPGYARVDAALFYKLPHGLQAQVNLENIFDAHYFATANGDNNIAPGAPRTLKATVRYGF
jgi:catecholate siderophore receptor